MFTSLISPENVFATASTDLVLSSEAPIITSDVDFTILGVLNSLSTLTNAVATFINCSSDNVPFV